MAKASEWLCGRDALAEYCQMSWTTLRTLLLKYPPRTADGQPFKINGRFRVRRTHVDAWLDHVARQQMRHPECRRLRPVEAPELLDIRAREPETDLDD